MITRFYPYTLTLQAPLLVTALEGDANSVRTLGFIPGSSIRGVVASGLNRGAAYPDFRLYILSGEVCYLNAYPMVGSRRTLPTPVSFRQEKYGGTTHDLACYSGEIDVDGDVCWPEKQLSGAEAPFLTLDQPRLEGAIATVESRMHQQRDRSAGRAYTATSGGATQARGTIFSYEALQAGQRFQGLVAVSGQCQKDVDSRYGKIKSVLRGNLSFGRSRNARYGGSATVSWDRARNYETSGDTNLVATGLNTGDVFCAYLTSDYIGRNRYSGQLDPTSWMQEIITRLGTNRIDVLRTRWAFRRVGGFNRKWGLQIPQAVALRGGSLLVLRAKSEIPITDLGAIEQSGLGERRPEGFGRVIFLQKPRTPRSLEFPHPFTIKAPTSAVPELIKTMQKRIMLDAIDRRITNVAADLARGAKRIPSPSLLGRLRVPLRTGSKTGLGTLRVWLDESEDHGLRRRARNQLNDCRIRNGRSQITLAHWIRDWTDNADRKALIKSVLKLPDLVRRNYIVSVEKATAAVDSDTAERLTVRLIDEVLTLLARKRRSASREVRDRSEE